MKSLKALCIILLAFAGRMYAAPIVSGGTGDWNNPATWAGGITPTAADIVTIANGHTVTVTANTSCAALIIGNGLLNQSSSLTVTAGILLAVSGNITITPPASGTVDNMLDVNAGAVSCSSITTANSSNNSLRCVVAISSGTLTCSGSFSLANNTDRNKLVFSGSGLLQLGSNSNTIADAQFSPSTGTIEYSGTVGQSVLPLSYYTLKCSGTTSKFLASNTILTGNLVIAGSAQLDVTSANNYSLTVGGNWLVTSTSTNPFVERKGTVAFNGSTGIQILTTPLAQENFYNLIINNTAASATSDLQFNKNCYVSQAYHHTNGRLDLKGNKLTIYSDNRQGVFTACNLSAGSIISSVAGSQVSFSDAHDSTFVNFTGTQVGDAAIPVKLTITAGRINIQNLSLYGIGTFIKKHIYDDVIAKGGNKFYSAVTFTANGQSGSWYTGAGDGALPDSFFSKASFYTYAANASSKFILGANSSGNYYEDTVMIRPMAAGSILIGNNSGAVNGTASSHYFNKLVDALVRKSGDIVFANGQVLLPCTVTFNKYLLLASAGASTGSIYVGKNTAGSSVIFTNTGQLYGANIYGSTAIYLNNIIQSGSLPQTLSCIDEANSKIICGDISGPCTWNGPVSFTAIMLDLAYSTFNGTPNLFTLYNAGVAQNCTGGNTFAAGTSSSFGNFGSADWRFGVQAPDDYNGDVAYRMNSTGAIYPAYNTNCTYSGNIIVLPGSDSIIFAAATNGRVTFDGSNTGYLTNNGTKPVWMKRITVNKTGTGSFVFYNNVSMPAGGDLTLTSGLLGTQTNGMLILMDESCTVTSTNAASTSYVSGPMRIDVSTTAPLTIHFPVGSKPDPRPIDLTIQHTSNTSYSYTAECVPGNANSLGWVNPASVYNVSTYRWWDIARSVTSSGAAAPVTDLVVSPLPVVSFYYGLSDRAPNPADVTIVKNTSSALTTWIDIGATGATNTIGKVTSVSSPSVFNSFSRFTLGFYGKPPAPAGRDSSRCGAGIAVITSTPLYGEMIDWYATPTGGTALATNTTTFTTPSISYSTIYYAEARNTKGYVSVTRTAVTAIVYNLPVVSTFSPTSGETGTTVTINGSNFNNNVSAVTFGGTPASSFTVNSPVQITAIVSSGASGAVAVTNGCGTGSKTGFTYNPLTVWTGAVSTAWAIAGNWDDGVPTNIHSAVITNVANQPLISSNQTIKSITIQPGAVVDIAVGNTLNVRDSLTNNGNTIGGGSIGLTGTASQPIRGVGSYTNLTLNNSSGAIIGSGVGNMVNIEGRYIPASGNLTTNNNFTLKSTAATTGTIAAGPSGGGYIIGKVILERYIPGRRSWRLINFPVTSLGVPTINESLQENVGGNASSNPNPGYGTHITGGTVTNGFDQNGSNNPSLKEWAGGAWQGIASTNTAINNQLPYFVFVRGSRANDLSLGTSAPVDNTVLRVNGNAKQGNQILSIGGAGWQLTGNPFPSVINLDAVATGNSSKLNRNFVFWDPKLGGTNNVGGYVTASYNGTGYDYSPAPVSDVSEYAQPFTGFFVDAISGGNITIAENMKCNCSNGNVFRPAPGVLTTSKLHISLRSVNVDGTNPVVDGAIAAFDERFSNEADSYDAAKLPNTLSENIAVAKSSSKFSIERRKALGVTDTVYLHMSNMRVRDYQLEIRPENFDGAVASAYLEDSYTASQTQLDMSQVNNYRFAIINNPAAYAVNRFKVVFYRNGTAISAREKKLMQEMKNAEGSGTVTLLQNPVINKTLILKMSSKKKGNYIVVITNADGKQVAAKQFVHDGVDGIKNIAIKKYLPEGLLTATIKDAEGSNTSFNILVQ